ncbi:MAG TPA: transcription elongation factor GreA [Patescibacteria group bacterium]|nr:transcription elongation factor GreA [Patescibacteria group bacterium]
MNANDKKVFLTQAGLDALQKEHDELVNVKRPQTVTELSNAREQGDLSENGAYTAAKEELAFVDGRIEELEAVLKHVEVIEDHHGDKMISLGSEVKVKIGDKEEIFKLVGEWEADPQQRKISHESPLGKALMGKAVGENVEVEAPAGKIVYHILKIG